MVTEQDVVAEVRDKVLNWQTKMGNILQDFQDIANRYRLIDNSTKSSHGLSRARTTETLRATETLTTMIYRMQTSQDPFFYLVPLDMSATGFNAQATERLLQMQLMRSEYKRKLLKADRSLCLFGSVIVEEPFVSIPNYQGNGLAIEYTDFIPRSLLQVAFDPAAMEIECSDFIAPIDFVTPHQLRYIAKTAPQEAGWNLQELEDAIKVNGNNDKTSANVQQRRTNAGYYPNENVLQAITYWGKLDCVENDDESDWVVVTINDTHLVKIHKNPYAHNQKPFRVAHYIDFELEPYGYGVGRVGKYAQKDLNANRSRVQDMITMNTFNMWIMSRAAGINPSQLRIRPNGFVETDMMEGIKPLTSDMNAANQGLNLEQVIKEDFRLACGASANLQAEVTQATATEASIAQNEAVRRISVLAEIISESLIRKHLQICHQNNVQLLDAPIQMVLSGEEKPIQIYPIDLVQEAEFYVKITTDKDFRPERLKNLMQFLQILTSVRNNDPRLMSVDILPYISEISRAMNLPFKVLSEQEQMQMAYKMQQMMKQNEGMGGGNPKTQAVESPVENPMSEQGGVGMIQTPMGDVMGSPNAG